MRLGFKQADFVIEAQRPRADAGQPTQFLDRIFHPIPSDDFILHLDAASKSTDPLRICKKKTAPEDCLEFFGLSCNTYGK